MSEAHMIEMGQITTAEPDGNQTEYPRAILLAFDSVPALKRAVLAEHCAFASGTIPLPTLPNDAAEIIAECHAASRRSGWWSDLISGESIVLNKGERLCLIHSEISEGRDADLTGAMDDKLTHRFGAEVELADAIIRLGDYLGGFGYPFVPQAIEEIKPVWMSWAGLHSMVSYIMEFERKRSIDDHVVRDYMGQMITEVIGAICAYAERRQFDLWAAIREKLAYNAQRADHKIENRRQAGGKVF